MDLVNELNNLSNKLSLSIKSLIKTGKDYAKAYTDYRVALAKELVRLKDDGMAVTIAYDVARGKPEIAKLKFNEIANEAVYKANLESINAVKLKIKIIQNQIDKEWGNNERI